MGIDTSHNVLEALGVVQGAIKGVVQVQISTPKIPSDSWRTFASVSSVKCSWFAMPRHV
jgi:hypothetical protein